jgi:hypothetical protein
MSSHYPNPVLMAKILLDRLERISADSGWAHQASGIRASLARAIAVAEPDLSQLSPLLELGFLILENAAGEIPEEVRTVGWENQP